jgi:hypothetical protein
MATSVTPAANQAVFEVPHDERLAARGNKGFGVESVRGRIRSPLPAASSNARRGITERPRETARHQNERARDHAERHQAP